MPRVDASSIACAPAQAPGLTYSTASPFPTKPALLGLCGGPIFWALPLFLNLFRVYLVQLGCYALQGVFCSLRVRAAVNIQFLIANKVNTVFSLASVDKGRHGFAGQAPRLETSLSSLPYGSKASSSASPGISPAPAKLLRTRKGRKGYDGKAEDAGGLSPGKDENAASAPLPAL